MMLHIIHIHIYREYRCYTKRPIIEIDLHGKKKVEQIEAILHYVDW